MKVVAALAFHSFAKSFTFLKIILNWGSITTSDLIPHIQKQTFLNMVLLKVMKTIFKNLIFN